MRTYKIVPLAPEALSKSYFKFLSVPLVLPKEGELERAKKLRGNPKDVLPFADRARLQDADYIPAPEGIYLADDGTIFISVIVDTPDLTGEMVAWWCAWHNLDPLRYAIWNPEDHYDVQVSEADRARILDESIPVQERIGGLQASSQNRWTEKSLHPVPCTSANLPALVSETNFLVPMAAWVVS